MFFFKCVMLDRFVLYVKNSVILMLQYNIKLDLDNLLAKYEAPPAGCFREEVKNMKIWFSSLTFMTNVRGATNT